MFSLSLWGSDRMYEYNYTSYTRSYMYRIVRINVATYVATAVATCVATGIV